MTVHPRGPQGQLPAVWVTESYPPVLRAALTSRSGIPVAARELVIEQLGHRTPGELRERVERRFFARFSHLPSGEITERADEIA
ncbi:hypothetical protein [Kitasatospora sp. NPDC002965]|uniref:hypothetical protein n=1 Tax=Kitasatospora sp. NPDC002965 TaxID=3154775 RepID=UPI0033B4FBBA